MIMFYIKKNRRLHTALAFALLLALGDAIASQSEAPYLQATRYNFMGQVTGIISADPDGAGPLSYSAKRITYENGRVTREENGYLSVWQDDHVAPASWSGFSISRRIEIKHDAYGRKFSVRVFDRQNELQSYVQYSYNQNNEVLCKVQRMNLLRINEAQSACELGVEGQFGPDRITQYEYSEFGLPTKEYRAVGTDLEQLHKSVEYQRFFGIPRFITDANGNVTELRYNAQKLLEKRLFPAKGSGLTGQVNENDFNYYGYDNNGNLTREIKRDGTDVRYAYDNLDRVITKDYIDNSASLTDDVQYDYDMQGLRKYSLFRTTSGQGVTHHYDGFGRIKSTSMNMGGRTRTLNYTYDLNGNRTRIQHPDGQYFSYRFDQLDRVTGVGEGTSSSNTLTVAYGNDGGRSTISRNGAVGATTSTGFYDGHRLESFQQDLNEQAHDLLSTFSYNPAKQVVQVAMSNQHYRYTQGRVRTGTYHVNGLNQYTEVAGKAFTYDDNGNLTDDGTTAYRFDGENRLVEVAGKQFVTLDYDPTGRLWRTVSNGSVTEFLYDGDALVAEYNGSNQLVKRYLHGDQVDEPWVQYAGSAVGSSARRYLHSDHRGSIIAHSDASGKATSTLKYDVFGIPDSGNAGRFSFTGQIWLPEAGLHYYKARVYSPELGRFLQTDPIFYEDQMNMYAYVGNDPVNNIDPTGEFIQAAIGAVIGAGLEAAIQYKKGQLSMSFDSVAKIGVAAASGAVGAGLASGIARFAATRASPTITNIVGNAAAGSLVGGSAKVAGNAIQGNSLMDGVAVSAAVGAALGGAASGAAEGLKAGVKSLSAKPSGIAYHVAETTGANIERGSRGAIGAADAASSVISNSSGIAESAIPKSNCQANGISGC